MWNNAKVSFLGGGWRRLAHVYAVSVHVDSGVPGLTSVSWFGTVILEEESLLQVFKTIHICV